MSYIRIRKVKCNRKGCGSCPHGPYAYLGYRDGDRVREIYLGRCRDSADVDRIKRKYGPETAKKAWFALAAYLENRLAL